MATPRQAMGAGGILPTLMEAGAVPAAAEPADGWKATTEAPKGAVPPEVRLPRESTPAAQEPKSTLPAGTLRAEARDAEALLALPYLTDVYPKSGYLVDSVTPTLRAWGRSSNGNYAVSYSFKICDVASMSGTGCTSSGYVAGNRNVWTVPAGKLTWGKQYWWTVTVKDSFDSSTATSPVMTFSTGVRQPAVSSWLGSQGTGDLGFDQQSGNYTTTATDLTVNGAGPSLSVVRTYNSMASRSAGLFGAGWSTAWDARVVKEVRGSSTSALVTYPDGRQARFRSNGDGTFQPPPGMYATLAEENGGWRLMDKAATTSWFDSAGRLTKVSDQRGRTQELTYDASGKLTTITGAGNRRLTFTFDGDHVATVSSDPVDGKSLTWTYSYDGDRLTQVCAPVAAPNCTTYDYSSGSSYRGAVLDADPFGYWRLGEASGTVAEDEGTGAGDATYQAVTLAQAGALAGTANTAASFTAGSALKLPTNTIAHLGDQISVETWFKTSQSGVLMAAGTTQTGGVASGPMLYVGTDGKLRGSFDTVASPITSTSAVNDGQWHHVALTVSGTAQTLYLDGAQIGTLSGQVSTWREHASAGNGITNPALSPAVPATAGAFPFQGQLDEVAVYGAPLTATEVQAHYQARAEAPYKLSTITLPSGRVQAVNTYDSKSDRIATHVDSNGGTWKIGAIGIEQQSGEAQVTVTDPDNNSLIYLYDAWRGYRIRGETDQLGYTTWHEYDQAGFLAKVIDKNDIANDIYQDKRGNTLGRKYCRAPGECAIEYWSYYLNPDNPFDPRNDRVIAYRDGRSGGDTDNTYATTTEYNSYGEQIKQTTPATEDFPSGRSVSIGYTDGSEPAIGGGTSPAGLVETKTDARGSQWSYRYTAAGDLAEQSEPEGLVTKLDYDAIGRLLSSTRISQAAPDGAKTLFTYDGRGRLVTSTTAGVKNEVSGVTHTAQTVLTYDPDGNTLTETVSDLSGGEAARAITYTYDEHGRRDSVTDPEGGLIRQEWNHRGWLTRVTDARGTVIDAGYSKRGELSSRTLKGWIGSPVNPQTAKDVVLETRGYDAGGRLAASADAMGRKSAYVYWMDNRLKQQLADDAKLNGSTTPRDVVVKAEEYDPAGNLIEQVTGGGLSTTAFDYDAASRRMAETVDPAGLARKTAFGYDANGNITKTTRTAAGTTRTEISQYVYNKLNQTTKQTVENGAEDLVSTIGYDDRGLAISLTDPRGNADGADAADYTTTIRYDLLERPVESSAPSVQVDKAGAAAQQRPSMRVGYDTAGNLTHHTDAEGRTTISTFDKAGRLTSSSAPSYTPPGGTAISPTLRTTYDAAGLRKTTTDPRGNITTYDYDQLGRQVRVTDPAPSGQTAGTWVSEYDLVGEKLADVDPTGARAEATYDDLGRKITSTRVERKPTAASYTTKLEYDDAGRLTKKTTPNNKATLYTVNPVGETTAITDPLTNKTTTAYDLAGRMIKTTDGNDNATVAEYDLAGRQIAAKDLDATGAVLRTFGYGYDAAGNKTSTTSPEGHVTKQAFDALNRLTSLTEPVSAGESITTSFGYDATGARTRLTDGRGNATWTSYNSLGLPETVTEPATAAHPDAADRTWTHLYDAAGNPAATIQPGGVRIDRIFDHLDRLTKESGAGGGATAAERTFDYDLAGRRTIAGNLTVDYNDRGLPLKVTRDSTQETAYAYDGLGNPTQRIDAAGTATFTYDNANRLGTVTDPITSRTLTYGYDKGSRLKTVTATSGTASTQTIDYDNMDRIKSQTLKNGSGTQLAQIVYGWDKDDNLTTKTTAGTAGAGTNTYGYDRAGRLTSWTAPAGAVTAYEWDAAGNRTKAGSATFTYDERNRLTSGGGTDYTYTPRGTVATRTTDGTSTTLTFDAFDQLLAEGDTRYSYDALGRIATKTLLLGQSIDRVNFSYAGLSNDLASVGNAAGARAKYARDPRGGLLAINEGTGRIAAALSDLHGDLVATYTTTVQSSTAYDPFGAVLEQTGGRSFIGYQGEYTDSNNGKVNMHARWYQPGTSTFTSRDSADLIPNPSVQANRYTYANASPLTGTDPTGHATVIDSGSLSGLGYSGSSYGGSGYGGSGSSGYTTISAGSYSSSGASGGGQCIGACGREDTSGGAIACMIWGCGGAIVDPSWVQRIQWNPGFSDEEAARIGVYAEGVGAGRPAPDGYWDVFGVAAQKARKVQADMYSPHLSDKQLEDMWKSIRTGPNKQGYYNLGNGWFAKPMYDPNPEVYYDFLFRIGIRRGVTAQEATTWIRNNFEKVFPFGGCKSPIVVGGRCNLTGLPGWSALGKTGPLKVVKVTPQSWMFEALDGHIDPTGALIRFTLKNGTADKDTGYGDWLWLNVKAWGPQEGIHSAGIEWFANLMAKDSWAVFARNIATRMPYDL
ncbi:LamG-like jellyroll fold domain-containing protein [Nonomuraea jabiensis]|uniref:LamG-like jellyroll fold domain-containing protein n=1 Tax=Nonomuraea jabiensis TaxID=882448 RepID=UPI003D70946A